MLPAIISGTIFTVLTSIVGVDNCTNIVQDQLAQGGISGSLELPWYCQEDLTTTPNPTPDNFELALEQRKSPVEWLADKLSSVWDWGGKTVEQMSSLTTLAIQLVLLIFMILMLGIVCVVLVKIYFLFRCCFQCFPVRKRKTDSTPQMSSDETEKLMAVLQKLGRNENLNSNL
ncbi:hypothetical protein Ddc_13150 [Ditylenchus destructor]|nr:hypothetical protein Ddc_13150 [Ditylenchus destructor]